MNITEKLKDILEENNGGAFLFVGSGFSRRYLGLEDWRGLLARFSHQKEFDYYAGRANNDLAKAAQLLAGDFYDYWWSNQQYQKNRERFSTTVSHETMPLRIEIAEYLRQVNFDEILRSLDEQLQREVRLLSDLNLDGIITTNWDLFLEYLFPDYQVFVGQKELLFSNLLEVGEIYKIHGSIINPDSLILTEDDYKDFSDRNPYLAAKLITIFVENPIIFIGYSLNDKNIRAILQSIVQCLDESNLNKLRHNLIFVQRTKTHEDDIIMEHTFTFENSTENLPITLIKTNDFSQIYEAIKLIKKKLPVKLLRYFKEQFYELAHSSEVKEKICVIEAENIDNYDNIEFVIGLGVQQKIHELGYKKIDTTDVFRDVLLNNANYDANQILVNFIPSLPKNAKYIPIFKYLNSLGINSADKYKEYVSSKKINISRFVQIKIKDLQTSNKYYKKKFSDTSIGNSKLINIIESNDLNNSEKIFAIPFLPVSELEQQLPILKQFLIDNIEQLSTHNNSDFKKLIVLYDLLANKWK